MMHTMSTRLIQIVAFTNVAPAATVALPHQININGIAKRPDYVAADASGFTITVTATQVSVTNGNAVPTSVSVWLELKHTIPRELGGQNNLVPQPFVAASGGSGGGPSTPQAVIFDDAIPANEVNIRSDRASNQSPIDNTKAGITNLGNATGAWTPSTGVQDAYSTISGGDDNSIVPGDGYNVIGGGAGHSVEGGNSGINSGAESRITGPGGYANVISGGDTNLISGGLYAAAIGGGDANTLSTAADESVIGGGSGNTVQGSLAAVVGGGNNLITNDDGFIGGGEDHTIDGFAGVICGGGSNNIHVGDDFSAIVGGDNNGIGTFGGDADNAFVGAGRQNHVDGDFSSIVGGANNVINNLLGGTTHSSILGGEGHAINDGSYNAIAGGQSHEIHGNNDFIGGGFDNLIDGGSNYSSVLGGNNNHISNADYASITGGRDNLVSQDYGHASGYNAQATSFYAHAMGAYVTAWSEGMMSWASADANFPAQNGRWQTDWLVGRFGPTNAPVGATQAFSFGQTYSNITLPDNKAYAIRVRMAAGGRSGGVGVGTQCVNIVQEIIVRKVAGVVTVVAQAQQSAVGTATATANWTVIGRASGADLFIDFSTGADATTTNVAATAHLEIVEVPLF